MAAFGLMDKPISEALISHAPYRPFCRAGTTVGGHDLKVAKVGSMCMMKSRHALGGHAFR